MGKVNRKRVPRIMREDNLLAVQPRAFVVTTDSNHDLEVYLNLAGRMKVGSISCGWPTSYIRLKAEFVYLAVILDAFSRKIVGWALDRTLPPSCRLLRWSARSRSESRLGRHI